jgi:hypothetical protein
MVAASFLIKNLGIDWRIGEAWFWNTLVDADEASNPASWQWVAGSGYDAAPYFRVFNPTSQSERFDPAGDYIRRWVPELAGVPPAYIHMPWTMPADVQQVAGCVIGHDYPAPLVDHATAVREAKRRLAGVRNAPVARSEARAVAERHGSRRDRRGAMQQDPVRRALGRSGPPRSPKMATGDDRQQWLPFHSDDTPATIPADTENDLP